MPTPSTGRNTLSGYIIIDVDTPVTETPDVWTSRVPDTMKDRAPYLAPAVPKMAALHSERRLTPQ